MTIDYSKLSNEQLKQLSSSSNVSDPSSMTNEQLKSALSSDSSNSSTNITPTHTWGNSIENFSGDLNSGIKNFAKGGVQGIADLSRGGLMGVESLANHVLPNSLQIPYPKPINVFKNDPQDASTMSSTIGNIAGQTIPFLAAAPEDIVGLGTGLISKGIDGAITGAATGAANSENSTGRALPGAATGGIVGGVLSSLLHVPGAALNHVIDKVSDSTHLGGGIVPASTASSIYNTAKSMGVHPDVGTVINHPALDNLYNFSLAQVPGSGIAANQQNTLDQISKATTNVMKDLSGGVRPGDIPDALKANVLSNKNIHTNNSSNEFKSIFNDLDNKGIQLTDSDFPHTAATGKYLLGSTKAPLTIAPNLSSINQDELNSIIKNNPITPSSNSVVTNNSSLSPEDLSNETESELNSNSTPDNNLDKSTTNSTDNNIPTSKLNNYTFNNIHRLQSNLLTQARGSGQKGDLMNQSLYLSLAKGINKDLNNKISSIDPDLSNRYIAAKQNFANNVVPYRDPQIRNILNSKTNSSTLPNVLLQTKNSKVYNDLSPQSKKQVLYSTLKNSAGFNANSDVGYSPGKLLLAAQNTLPKLPDYVANNPNTQTLQDLLKVKNLYTKANVNINAPATGMGVKKRITGLAGLALGGGLGVHMGLPIESLAALAAGAVGGARYGGKLLTSRPVINAVVNPSNSKLAQSLPLLSKLSYPVVSTLTNNRGNQNVS